MPKIKIPKIDWEYPFIWSIDLKSPYYRSVWLGWILITWNTNPMGREQNIWISFQPGL